jgi:hypothetical protein
MAAQETSRVLPTVVEAGAPPGQDEETLAALIAAQETSKVPPTVLQAGRPPGQDEETLAALMAAQGDKQAAPNGGGSWDVPWIR